MFEQKNKVIPMDQIESQDIEKFLVRSAIIVAPYLWGKYEDFIRPLTPGTDERDITVKIGDLWDYFINRNPECELFEKFVKELKDIKNKTDLSGIERQRIAVGVAKSYCALAEKEGISGNIFPQLKVISENIEKRKVVEHYTRSSGYGTM